MEKFNHEAKHTAEALGITEKQAEELSITLAKYSMLILKEEVSTFSEIAELLANNLSYKELVFLATHYVIGATEDVVKIKLSNIKPSI